MISSARMMLLKIGPCLVVKSGLGVVDQGADDVGRQHVGGKLQALERSLEQGGQGFDRQGFCESGYAFQKDVAIGKQANDQAVD